MSVSRTILSRRKKVTKKLFGFTRNRSQRRHFQFPKPAQRVHRKSRWQRVRSRRCRPAQKAAQDALSDHVDTKVYLEQMGKQEKFVQDSIPTGLRQLRGRRSAAQRLRRRSYPG